jgi:hypothetical protein
MIFLWNKKCVAYQLVNTLGTAQVKYAIKEYFNPEPPNFLRKSTKKSK